MSDASARPAWADETVDYALQLAAWRCRDELHVLSAAVLLRRQRELEQEALTLPMLEFDKVDLCVHTWRSVPCLDLLAPGRRMPPVYRCARCAWPTEGLKSRELLPAIGRGRYGKTESGNH